MFFWSYATGVGVTSVEPRTDIIFADGSYATKEQGFDIDNEAPYTYESLDPTENFVVYSSGRSKEPLFCVSVVETDVGENKIIKLQYKITIETRYAYFECYTSKSYGGFDKVRFINTKYFKQLPFDEHSKDENRMGLVELNKDSFNAINTLLSNIEDMVVDNANMLFVFKNTDVSQEAIDKMKESGAVVISDTPDNRGGGNADIKTITIEIPFNGFIDYTESLLVPSYDIAGVPLASGQVTSGGDTGQARLLGGGWNNAYTIIKNDMNSLLLCDYDMLKLMLYVCKLYESCPIDKLNASQVDIKYRINQSDNFLVKAQGINQLYATNMPKDIILKYAGISSDIGTEGAQWEAKDKEVKSQATKEEVVVEKTGGNGNEPTAQTENNA